MYTSKAIFRYNLQVIFKDLLHFKGFRLYMIMYGKNKKRNIPKNVIFLIAGVINTTIKNYLSVMWISQKHMIEWIEVCCGNCWGD